MGSTQLPSWSLASPSKKTKILWQFAGHDCSQFSWALLNIAGADANGKTPSKAELHQLYLSEKYVWKWKQFMSRRGKRTCPLDLKLGHNNWLRQVKLGRALGQSSVTQGGWFAAVPGQRCLGRLALTASNSKSGLQLWSLRNAASNVSLGVCGFLNSEPLIATVLLLNELHF